MLTLADTGVTADWFSLNWFALFRGEKKPTLPQRELVKLPHDVQRAYLAVNKAFFEKFREDLDNDKEALEYASEATGLSIRKVAEVVWDTSDLYDSEHGRWWHENYWKWKLFKRL